MDTGDIYFLPRRLGGGGRKKPRDVTERILRIALYFEPRNFWPGNRHEIRTLPDFIALPPQPVPRAQILPSMDMEKQVDR